MSLLLVTSYDIYDYYDIGETLGEGCSGVVKHAVSKVPVPPEPVRFSQRQAPVFWGRGTTGSRV
jgi:hypothetical protein